MEWRHSYSRSWAGRRLDTFRGEGWSHDGKRESGLTLLMNKERGHGYRRPLLCQPFRAVKNVAGLHDGHLRGVHAFPLFHWSDMPLDVLLHTGNCPALDAPPTRGGARGPWGGLPPTEARGVIRADMHIAKPPQWPDTPTHSLSLLGSLGSQRLWSKEPKAIYCLTSDE